MDFELEPPSSAAIAALSSASGAPAKEWFIAHAAKQVAFHSSQVAYWRHILDSLSSARETPASSLPPTYLASPTQSGAQPGFPRSLPSGLADAIRAQPALVVSPRAMGEPLKLADLAKKAPPSSIASPRIGAKAAPTPRTGDTPAKSATANQKKGKTTTPASPTSTPTTLNAEEALQQKQMAASHHSKPTVKNRTNKAHFRSFDSVDESEPASPLAGANHKPTLSSPPLLALSAPAPPPPILPAPAPEPSAAAAPPPFPRSASPPAPPALSAAAAGSPSAGPAAPPVPPPPPAGASPPSSTPTTVRLPPSGPPPFAAGPFHSPSAGAAAAPAAGAPPAFTLMPAAPPAFTAPAPPPPLPPGAAPPPAAADHHAAPPPLPPGAASGARPPAPPPSLPSWARK